MYSSSLRKFVLDRCSAIINGGGSFPNFVSTLHCSSQALKEESQNKFHMPLPRQHEWNRTVASAEKLVGFPTSAVQLTALLNDDVTSMTQHLRKLMGSDHPILRTIKRLVHHGGKTNCQIRGLMVLLLSRATSTEQVLYIHTHIYIYIYIYIYNHLLGIQKF